jgi:N-acetyl-gamma-glutamyl-phosphate reductase
LPDEIRKNVDARKEALNSCDIAFLCLPDAAAVEAVSLIENENTALIDTSTAHRVDPRWTYGFPEICGYDAVRNSKRIANPGCHASGFVALAAPLVRAGIIGGESVLHCFSITGYSGGGKQMIAEYEGEKLPSYYDAPRQYGLSQQHKHLKEMSTVCGLSKLPLFSPIVAPFYSGMEVIISLSADDINGKLSDISDVYKEFYSKGGLVKFCENADENGFLSASKFSMRDDMEIAVFGNEERFNLVARFDNLGKGASGSAIQNMNILLGCDEKTGLVTE